MARLATLLALVFSATFAFWLRPAVAERNDVIWVEAEQFARYGGWSNDSQFVDLMGSPYLLATGVGRPVEDAVTRIHVGRAGRYRLWVRCKDWYPQYSPGRFRVVVAGKASPVTFGKAGDDRWQWIDGGVFDLPECEIELRLEDLTGWWGRCDAIVLSGDSGFRPADDLEQLAKQRQAYGGLSPDVEEPGPYDVVVVGGGLAGSAAAVAAARGGARVVLIQDRPVLGGNASREIGVEPQGDMSREPLDPRETGIIEEFEPRPEDRGDWSASIERVVRGQRGLDLFLNTRATGVEMEDGTTIAAVRAFDVRRGTRYRFRARIFIDCTGDGWVGFWAGADYRHGRESRHEWGESLAPAKADRRTMGNTLYMMAFRIRDKPVEFKAPLWAYRWRSPEDFQPRPRMVVHTSGERPPSMDDLRKGRGGRPGNPGGGYRTWWVEFGGMYDTIKDAEWIRDELFRINIGLWDYVKNYDPRYKGVNRNRELVWLNYVPGKRESRRLLGDYVMTQRDFVERTVHPDTVAYAGWGIDIHHPWGFFAPGPLYFSAYRYKVSIPYRILYSRNISNLMMAGRDVSVSHIALGSVRVMRTCCMMGEAAGTAAAIAVKRRTTPRGVYQRYLDELQETLLKNGNYLIGRPNRDPRDLARSAVVSASSFATIADVRAGKGQPVETSHELNVARAVMFKATRDKLDSLALFLRSKRDKPTELRAVLCAARASSDFSSTTTLAEAVAVVPARKAGWVEFPLSAALKPGNYYYLALPRAEGISWDLYSFQPEGTTRAYGGPNWIPKHGCYKFKLNPGGEPVGRGPAQSYLGVIRLVPENVINGWNRAVEGVPNSWSPDPQEPLPQWLELDFRKPVEFNSVHVTFQLAAMAARAYRLDVCNEAGSWKTIVRVGENRLRRRVHMFKRLAGRRLRLVIEKPAPDGQAPRVCEIRVYNEREAAGEGRS